MYPKVSILTPTLNAMKYLDLCLESVLSQNYENIEHVFADAGSTDGTYEHLQELNKKYPDKIKVVQSLHDQGVGDGLNAALSNSTGSIIGWLDSDDQLEPNSISQLVNLFNKNPETQFVFGNCNIINEKGKIVGEFIVRDFDKWEWVNRWHYIIFCGAYFRKEVVDKVGFVNSLGNDLDFFLKVSKKYNLEKVDVVVANWRYHEGSISHNNSTRAEKIRFNRAKQDFLIVIKNHGSIFSPKAINFILILGKKIFSNRILRKFATILQIQKLKNLLVYNIANSNSFIYPKESFSLKILKILLWKLKITQIWRITTQKVKQRISKFFPPVLWMYRICQFILLEIKHLQRRHANKKKYETQKIEKN